MLSHTQSVHAGEAPYADAAEAAAPARAMPSGEPGPVATERASQTDFEVEPASPRRSPAPGRTSPRGPSETEAEDDEKQNPTLGTLIGLIVIAAIIILNLLTGGGGD